MYKSCPLFVLHVLTTKIECSYLHTFLVECVYEERPTEFPGFHSLENRRQGEAGRGRHKHLGTLITRAVLYGWVYTVLDTHTSSDSKLSYAGTSQYELRQECSFLLFSKAFITF